MQEKLFFETVQHASAVLVSIALQLCLHSPMGGICKNPGPSSKAIYLPSNHLQVVQRFPKVMLSTERPSQSCNLFFFFFTCSRVFVPEIALEPLILFTRHILRDFQKERSTSMLMLSRTEESFWWGFFSSSFFTCIGNGSCTGGESALFSDY